MLWEVRRAAGEVLESDEMLERELCHDVDVGSSFGAVMAQGPSSVVLEDVRVDEVLEADDLQRRRRRLKPA